MNPRQYQNELGLEVKPNNRIFSDNAPEISPALRFIMSMSLSSDIEGCSSPRLPDDEKVFVINGNGMPKNILGHKALKSVPWNLFAWDVETPTHFVFILTKKSIVPSTYLEDLKKELEDEASKNSHLNFSILFHQ